jgi:uncharacterized metal-binding protein YceD (DUF177 family)
MRTSEARKRAEEAEAAWNCQRCEQYALQCERCAKAVVAWRHERAREIVQQALEAVYSGAGFSEADALLDQLETRGARVEVGLP